MGDPTKRSPIGILFADKRRYQDDRAGSQSWARPGRRRQTLDGTGTRVFVNEPDAWLIEVVDLLKGEVSEAFPTEANRSNFPMAIDREGHRLLVVFRSPVRLLVMSTTDGSVLASLDTCGDADDVFVDAQRHRIYVSCGAGIVDVFEERSGSYQRIDEIGTAPGARTSPFIPEMDRLYVAARAAGGEPAAIWVFRPAP